jgi:hypothetical protein
MPSQNVEKMLRNEDRDRCRRNPFQGAVFT